MKKNEFRLLFLCLSLSFLFNIIVQPSNSAAQMKAGQNFLKPSVPPANSNKGDILPGRYIVKFKDPPLSVYRGGLPNLPPTNPSARGEKKLNASDPDSINYLNYLSRRHSDIHHKMEKVLGRGINIAHAFQVAFNGVAVKMSAAEARRIAKLPGIVDVIPDKMRHLHTDNGPQWIDADDVWDGSVSAATKGEGIVIGIIDTGINPANASFADVGGDGYNHSNPRSRYYGFCDSGHPDYNAAFQCNDKLIGAYDFARDSGESAVLYDNDGHGSHVTSTAAGNLVDPAALVAPTISFNRTISGVAPHSNIISYKACRDGCKLSWLLAAIEQATLDGVDVINYSLGGGATDPWAEADSEAFLNARQAGIFVATSAGNAGPGSETLSSPGNAPWLLTVGSSSHDRRFNNSLTSLTGTGGPLSNIPGQSVTDALSTTSIVYAGDDGDALCLNPFSAGTFSGEIVVCDRGQIARVKKGENVLAGGAGGYVLANDEPNGDSIDSDAHALPAVHIRYNDGVSLKNWLAAGSNHQAAISGTTVDVSAAYGNIMSSFSSRGANAPLLSVIKPDVSAPGQDVLAADGSENEAIWGLMSGTSMCSPHAAGAAALLMDLYPDWSPAEIQSALMTSADPTVLKEDATTPADPFDTGTGRIAVSQAAQAGIVLDETYTHYVDANPAKGGDPKTLNIPSLGNENIVFTATWNRTLTSSLDTSMEWNAAVTNPSGVTLTVDPSIFTLPAGGAQQVAITADAGAAAFDNWLFGSVVFTPTGAGTVPAKFPVALKRDASNLPDALRYDNVAQISSKTLQNREALEITDLTPSYYGLAGATVHTAKLYQDPTPGNPYDGDWAPEDGDGLWVKMVTVPANTKQLVAEIVETNSPDIDMYLYRKTGAEWVWVCSSNAGGSSNEYCSVLDPVAGDYYIWMHNYEARDPGGTNPDNVQLATAVVPDASAGNLTVSLANGGNSVPAGQPFDLKISWNLTGTATHWYGRFGLGTDSANPNNLGIVDLDLHVNHPPMPWLLLLLGD